MENYTITVPCKKYIKKYFSSVYGDVLKPTLNDDFGDSIITKLSSKPISRLSKQDTNILLKGLDDKIKIRVPIDYFYRLQNSLTDQHIYTINRFLNNRFDNDFFIFVNIGTAFGVERRKVVEYFCNRYNIILDHDATLESMIKKELRLRSDNQLINNFLVGLSSKFHIYMMGGVKAS